jgi:hypothetical protein
MITQESKEALRRLMELRQHRDEAKVAAETSEKAYREAEADVYEALEESGIKSTVKVDLGEPWGTVSFKTRETYYGKIYDADAALAYYDQRGLTPDMTNPKFVMKRVNEEVRSRVEQGESMPPGVDYYANRGVTITRQKG